MHFYVERFVLQLPQLIRNNANRDYRPFAQLFSELSSRFLERDAGDV